MKVRPELDSEDIRTHVAKPSDDTCSEPEQDVLLVLVVTVAGSGATLNETAIVVAGDTPWVPFPGSIPTTANGTCTLSEAVPAIAPELAVIVASPADAPVARPLLPAVSLIETADDEEDHVTAVVTTAVLPSLNIPVAVSACV